MYTSHGHQIPGTPVEGDVPARARCGGISLCVSCSVEARVARDFKELPISTTVNPHAHDRRQQRARLLVFEYLQKNVELPGNFTPNDVYVVWFARVLANWKALVSTNLNDGMYYEVTYDGEFHRAYLDGYKKSFNQMISNV